MDIEELRRKQASFEGNRQELKKEFKKEEKERKRFISKFSLDTLRNLPIDKYVAGKPDTFCYWVETKLMGLGKIKGGSPADKKFGIYFGKTKHDSTKKYRFIKKWGTSIEESYMNVINEIVSLLDAGENKELEIINNNKLSPMFKGKILATYYPKGYLNIFAHGHLDFFLEKLGMASESNLSLPATEKREKIMQFKNSDIIMKDWSIYEFSNFLYTQIGRPADYDKTPEELKEYISIKYPSLSKVKAQYINFQIQEIPQREEQVKDFRIKLKKVDFERENKINKQLGDRGEDIVIKKEKEYLKKIGKPELASKIKHISKEDDSAGYDVLSYNDNGKEKYIEVKSTKSKPTMANFLVSDNQIRKSRSLDNYYVYIVFEANTKNPKVVRIYRPFDMPQEKVKVTPVNYRVVIKIK